MKPNLSAKTQMIFDIIVLVCGMYFVACAGTTNTAQKCEGDQNLTKICVDNTYYALDTSGSGTGCGPKCKLLVINNRVYTAPSKEEQNSDTSFLSIPPKEIELNGRVFRMEEYEKEGIQMLDSKWVVINNRLYKRK